MRSQRVRPVLWGVLFLHFGKKFATRPLPFWPSYSRHVKGKEDATDHDLITSLANAQMDQTPVPKFFKRRSSRDSEQIAKSTKRAVLSPAVNDAAIIDLFLNGNHLANVGQPRHVPQEQMIGPFS